MDNWEPTFDIFETTMTQATASYCRTPDLNRPMAPGEGCAAIGRARTHWRKRASMARDAHYSNPEELVAL
jgi:hypothetical protein